MPIHKHDCENCKFIKTQNNEDYYFCGNNGSFGGWNLVIRQSSEVGDYQSYNSGWFRDENLKREDPHFRDMSLVLLHYLAGTEERALCL